MNKIDKILSKYVIFTIPLIIILMTWGSIGDPDKLSLSTGMTRTAWDFLGWIFMFWTAISLYLTVKMVCSKKFRDVVLKKFAGVKDRDERESLIAGEAAKFSFLSTMAILFLFLFLSIFTITIGKHPEGIQKTGKRGYISMGLNFYPFSSDSPVVKKVDKGLEIFTYSGVPLSSSMMIIIILLWQFGSYKFIVRRESLE